MEEYKNLVVIGNGFDVAHGLNTRYSDFMFDVWNRDREFYEQLTKYIFEDDLWNDFENALGFLDVSEIREMSEAIYLHYHEMYSESQQVVEEELKFSDRISDFLFNWIKSIDTCVKATVTSKIINNQNIYLNFNYTDTLEKVYGIQDNNICYIHGKAMENDKLIIGHRNEFAYMGKEPAIVTYEEWDAWLEFQMNKTYREITRDTNIQQYFVNTYKDTESIIKFNREFFSKLKGVDKIYILGHSLAYVDIPYFREIYNCTSRECKWVITYYSDRDKRNAENFVAKLGIRNNWIDTFDKICKKDTIGGV